MRHKRLGLTPLVASVYLDRSRLCFMFREGIRKRDRGRSDWLRRILRLTLPEDDVHPARIRKAAAFVLRSVARNVFRESGWTGATACTQGWSTQTPLRLRTVQPGHQNLTFPPFSSPSLLTPVSCLQVYFCLSFRLFLPSHSFPSPVDIHSFRKQLHSPSDSFIIVPIQLTTSNYVQLASQFRTAIQYEDSSSAYGLGHCACNSSSYCLH